MFKDLKRMLDKKSKQMETEMEIIKNLPNGNYSPRNKVLKFTEWGNSLVVQSLGLHAPTAGGMDSVPSQGTETLHAAWPSQKIDWIRLQVIRDSTRKCWWT